MALAFAFPWSPPTHAQDRPAEVDKIFRWVTPGIPGCAVAVSHNGKQAVSRADGLADLEREVTAFDYGNPVVRNVPFTRLDDHPVRC